MRIGQGFDVHQLVEGRKLIIGGVEIHYDKGLLGHSDADVLLHAISDALLGAAALGDIGRHFADTDAKFKNIDSRILLREAMHLVREQGYRVGNVDATIIAHAPKMAPHIPPMVAHISPAPRLQKNPRGGGGEAPAAPAEPQLLGGGPFPVEALFSTRKSAAICATICGICGAILGACAMMVASTLPTR